MVQHTVFWDGIPETSSLQWAQHIKNEHVGGVSICIYLYIYTYPHIYDMSGYLYIIKIATHEIVTTVQAFILAVVSCRGKVCVEAQFPLEGFGLRVQLQRV